jgi:hypothetical protein
MIDLFIKVRFLIERKMEEFFPKVPNFFYVTQAELSEICLKEKAKIH